MSRITKGGLRRFNLIMAVIHLAQATAILILSTNFKLPVTGNYLMYDHADKTLVPTTKTLFNLPLTWLIAAFFIISGLSHLFVATVYNKRYNKNLNQGRNPVRWWEYGLGASVMMVAIAMLVGVYDIDSLAMIFGLTAIMCLMGLFMEHYNQGRERTSWWPYLLGTFAGLIPWLVVAHYLRLAADQSGNAPTFVYFIFISMFLAFSSFAVNMFLHYRRYGKWRDYLYTERAYIILSLVAKTALAWQVFAGTLRP